MACIAAVADVEVVSRTQDDLTSVQLRFEGGKVAFAGSSARSRGTTVAVTKLFPGLPEKSLRLSKR